MIEYKIGDILTEDSEALVNTVNCVGVMGRGVALQFKRRFPDNFKAYATECKQGRMKPGCVFVYDTGNMHPPRYIINFPTKRHWRGKSRMEDIESGLESLANSIRSHRIRSIAIPPLGSGLGGLEWAEVRARMEAELQELYGVEIVIFEPGGGTSGYACQSFDRCACNDSGAGNSGWTDGHLPARLVGSVPDAARGPQAHVLHAGSRRTLATQVYERVLRTLCGKSAPRSAQG